jgi:hypothetical protein
LKFKKVIFSKLPISLQRQYPFTAIFHAPQQFGHNQPVQFVAQIFVLDAAVDIGLSLTSIT